MDYVIDTSFLIGRWRQKKGGAEQRFIETHPDDSVLMPWIVKGEFLRGAVLAGHSPDDVRAFLSRYPTLWPTEATLFHYAQTYAALVRTNQLIGPNDLWIAASALEHGLALLTRNASEFRRVPDLSVIDYSCTPR
jgi:tRNA(fMet)-specific endonuclease VapC